MCITLKYYVLLYINTNEIPSELSRENVISSHVKRSLLLWIHIKIVPYEMFSVSAWRYGISLLAE